MKISLSCMLGAAFTLSCTQALSASEFKLAVGKDASLVSQSLCCAKAASSNFGSTKTVDAGQYHHSSKALFGFTLPDLGDATLLRAELVLPASQVVGSVPATLGLSSTTDTWEEKVVTWNSRPTLSAIANFEIREASAPHLDITSAVIDALAAGQSELSFAVEAKGQTNVFFTSKEANADGAAYLVITTDTHD